MIWFQIWLEVQNEVIKPSINGVLDIMKACQKAKTVRRLVFTSSAGTLNAVEHQKQMFDESCWSDVEFCRRVKMTGWVSIFIWIFLQILKCTQSIIMISFILVSFFVDVFCFKDTGRARSVEICPRAWHWLHYNHSIPCCWFLSNADNAT